MRLVFGIMGRTVLTSTNYLMSLKMSQVLRLWLRLQSNDEHDFHSAKLLNIE